MKAKDSMSSSQIPDIWTVVFGLGAVANVVTAIRSEDFWTRTVVSILAMVFLIFLCKRALHFSRYYRYTVIAVGFITALCLVVMLIFHKPEGYLSPTNQPQKNILTDQQVTNAIQKIIDNNGDCDTAIKLLFSLDDGSRKREECERVFGFCIKNWKLDEAKDIVNECWKGNDKKEKLAHITRERLKQ